MEESTTAPADAAGSETKIDVAAEGTLKLTVKAILFLGTALAVICVIIGLTGLIGGRGAYFIFAQVSGVLLFVLSLLIYSVIKVFADMSVTLKEINSKMK